MRSKFIGFDAEGVVNLQLDRNIVLLGAGGVLSARSAGSGDVVLYIYRGFSATAINVLDERLREDIIMLLVSTPGSQSSPLGLYMPMKMALFTGEYLHFAMDLTAGTVASLHGGLWIFFDEVEESA
jgi:hypothetical protein